MVVEHEVRIVKQLKSYLQELNLHKTKSIGAFDAKKFFVFSFKYIYCPTVGHSKLWIKSKQFLRQLFIAFVCRQAIQRENIKFSSKIFKCYNQQWWL